MYLRHKHAYRGAVCRLLTELRLSHKIPFGYIADNTRWMRKPDTYDGVDAVLASTVRAYRRALWTRMPHYVEVWIEKDALAGVVNEVTSRWDVPLMVTKGYASFYLTCTTPRKFTKVKINRFISITWVIMIRPAWISQIQ